MFTDSFTETQSWNLKLDLQSQKTISFVIAVKLSLNIRIDKYVFRSDLETTILAPFPSKSLSYTVISSYLTEIVNVNHCEFHHLHRNRYYVANKCGIIESNYDV